MAKKKKGGASNPRGVWYERVDAAATPATAGPAGAAGSGEGPTATSSASSSSTTKKFHFDPWAERTLSATDGMIGKQLAKKNQLSKEGSSEKQKTLAVRELFNKIEKPDYAVHPKGHPVSEIEWPESKIPVVPYDSEELQTMRRACQLGREVLDLASTYVHVGMSGDTVDKVAVCVSVNDCICHGIPRLDQIFQHGDLVNVDISIYHKGWHADLNETFLVYDGERLAEAPVRGGVQVLGDHDKAGKSDAAGGTSSTKTTAMKSMKSRKVEDSKISNTNAGASGSGGLHGDHELLIQTAYNCLFEASKTIKPGTLYRSVGNVITKTAHEAKCSVVSTYCGHGIGKLFHGPPQVPHYKGSKVPGLMKPGHIFTIEPMINLGVNNAGDDMLDDGWSAVTTNGAPSAQFEHTFLVTETGYECLTLPPEDRKNGNTQMPPWNRDRFLRIMGEWKGGGAGGGEAGVDGGGEEGVVES
eukprot:g3735.t1